MDYLSLTALIKSWLATHGWKVTVIIGSAYLAYKFLGAVIEKAIRRTIVADPKEKDKQAEEKRENTLIRVAVSTLNVVIWIAALLMVVSEFNIEIGPIIAAAGIVGIAVGFGGQYLIRDIIAGLFIVLENQYRLGDVVRIGDVAGTVEHISLRKTVLRGKDGEVYYIPNGEIKIAANLTKDFARVNLDIGVSYNANINRIKRIVNEVGTKMNQTKQWKKILVNKPKFVRINRFDDSAVIIRVSAEVEPGKQWSAAGELRRRLKSAFDKEGIEIPYPQQVVHCADSKTKKQDKN